MKALAEFPHVASDQLTQAAWARSVGDVVTCLVGVFRGCSFEV